VAIVAVLALGAGAGGYFGAYAAHHKKAPHVAPPPAAYRAATAAPRVAPARAAAPAPRPAQVVAALAALLAAPELGSAPGAEVVDVRSGKVLFARAASITAAPASTAKLLTGVAVLAVHKASDRITTRVLSGAGGTLFLMGGGDPTLSGAASGKPTAYPEAARISDLAAQLRRAHLAPRRIEVDDSVFRGPAVSPGWAPEDVPTDYASAITAVLADGGRAAPADAIRSATPDLAAGRELAAALGRPALPVGRGSAPAGARVLATVSSAPISTLVEQMLENSDNVIAEALARQVALAEHQPASFSGAARAVRTVLRRLGVDPGAGMLDGSGLAAADRLSPASLAGVVRLAALRPALRTLLAALPVAAWSGTLADRYVRGSQSAGAGVVRAKTGTLTGVATLAGTVHDRSGRLLAFALMSHSNAATTVAEAALDKLAARLATL
jgi:D-alanyl-D-alanine carboxypeptidase/D-alanyl-D-alanine-endopeptidase (penicillin-binding protein 4)